MWVPSRQWALALTFALAIVCGALPCRAGGLLIEAPDLTVTPGSSGSFDLLLVNTNSTGGDSYNIAADQFMLTVSGPLDIQFTSESINTVTAPYLFVQSGGSVFDQLSPYSFTAADAEFASPFFRTVNPGDIFGLAQVSYSVSPTVGNGRDTLTVSLIPNAGDFFFYDANGNGIPAGVSSSGSFTVGSAIPEPWAITQAATAAIIGLGLVWRRRMRQGK
jgi:hypothetical protein